jgi:hypothetical protein
MKRFALPCFKRKRGETSYEKLHVSKEERKKEDEICKLLGGILLK